MDAKQVAAVITAAGFSSRMGTLKALLPLGSQSMIRHMVGTFRAAGCDPIVVVTGHQREAIEAHLADLPVTCLYNPAYAQGDMFDSVKVAFTYLQDRCKALFFVPTDSPLFTKDILEALKASSAPIALPVYGQESGHPLYLKANLLPRLLAYSGEGGLRGAIQAMDLPIDRVPVGEEGILWDADTPADYEKIFAYYEERQRKEKEEMGKRYLYLLRHGAIREAGEETRCIGRTDLALVEEGRLQALALRDYFRDRPLDRVYASPLKRCRETAALVFPGREIIYEPALMEQDCGAWEGLTFAEIRVLYPDLYLLRGEDLNAHPPAGGEAFAQALVRFREGIRKALDESRGDLTVVAHATVNRLFLADLLGMDLADIHDLPQPYACVNVIEIEGEKMRPLFIGQEVQKD